MPRLTALLHTHNDGLRVGRCLETLYPCDEILIVDHGSTDQTLRIAREYGARTIAAAARSDSQKYLCGLNSTWILCLDARESLTEALAASLFEWKSEPLAHPRAPFAIPLREETGQGWTQNPVPQTRLVPSDWPQWEGFFPAAQSVVSELAGEILRFEFP